MSSNWTNKEYFNFHGTLTPERIEALLDAEAIADSMEDIQGQLSEAIGCYPDEDFAQAVLDNLQSLLKQVRGTNRTWVESIIGQISDLQQTISQQAEYGISVLKDI